MKMEMRARLTRMEHFFNDEIRVYQNASKEEIKDEFRNFLARVNSEIENWTEAGSGWEYVEQGYSLRECGKISDSLVAGTYIPLPAKL